jgi:hypothetical protein
MFIGPLANHIRRHNFRVRFAMSAPTSNCDPSSGPIDVRSLSRDLSQQMGVTDPVM